MMKANKKLFICKDTGNIIGKIIITMFISSIFGIILSSLIPIPMGATTSGFFLGSILLNDRFKL